MKPLLPSRMICTLVAAGCLSALSVGAATPDVSGIWKWTSQGRNGETRESSMTLKQEGAKVTGTVTGRQEPTPITEGKIEGDKLVLKVTRETQRGSMTADYQGQVAGNTITGETKVQFGDREMTREWIAKRADADPAGTWQWSMESPDGQTWEATLTIRKSGDTITGSFARPESDWELPIQDAKVHGSTFTFQTVFERDGNSMTIKNTAVITGNTMNGKSMRQDAGGEEPRTWKATRQPSSQ